MPDKCGINDTNKAWPTRENLTEMLGLYIDFEVFLVRFGPVAIPNLKNSSIRSGAGPRVETTFFCINSWIDFGTNFTLKSQKATSKTHYKFITNKAWNLFAKSLSKRCRKVTDNQTMFNKNTVGCFCRDHFF